MRKERGVMKNALLTERDNVTKTLWIKKKWDLEGKKIYVCRRNTKSRMHRSRVKKQHKDGMEKCRGRIKTEWKW